MTETAFVRISSNPQFTTDAVAPADAVLLLNGLTSLENHDFWPDDLRLSTALRDRFLAGHRQITDAYLVALAVKHRGRLATFDRAVTGHLTRRRVKRSGSRAAFE